MTTCLFVVANRAETQAGTGMFRFLDTKKGPDLALFYVQNQSIVR